MRQLLVGIRPGQQAHGRLHLRYGSHIDWRVVAKPGGTLALRLGDLEWWMYALTHNPEGTPWSVRCPGCGEATIDLYFPPARAVGMCHSCHLLRRETDRHHGYGKARAFQAELAAGNGSKVRSHLLANPGDGLYVRQALELQGLLPVKFSLEPAWDRKLKAVRRSRARKKQRVRLTRLARSAHEPDKA